MPTEVWNVRRMRPVLILAGVALLVSSCGSSTPSARPTTASPSPTPATCSPSGPVQVVAIGLKFDKPCLATPAGKAFTLTLDNTDQGTMHNVAIFRDQAATDVLFRGDIVTGPVKKVYNVPALTAGAYLFRCDVHPVPMQGSFIVA